MPAIRNVHERALPTDVPTLAGLVASLATADDRLWPHDRWPAMRFDRPLRVGAVGGHGPIRYFVESYTKDTHITFRFTAPRGFHGYHAFDIIPSGHKTTILRHILEMTTTGLARLTWPLIYRPLHDALIEDALDRAEIAVAGMSIAPAKWSTWVRVLRWIIRQSTLRQARRGQLGGAGGSASVAE
jgi:hypothetical protein